MPDRAVVDEVPCAWCGGDGYVTGSMPCPECTPPPRALVALSEDRKTIVALEPDLDVPATSAFSIWGWDMKKGHVLLDVKVDTGQGADAVLADWLARHDGR